MTPKMKLSGPGRIVAHCTSSSAQAAIRSLFAVDEPLEAIERIERFLGRERVGIQRFERFECLGVSLRRIAGVAVGTRLGREEDRMRAARPKLLLQLGEVLA